MKIIFGYADPGSGALIWQFLTAIAFGCLFYLKSFFSFIKKIFKK